MTHTPPTATVREDWYGSWYDLAIEVGPAGDDRRLLEALGAVWRAPGLRGPWPRPDAGAGARPVDVHLPLAFEDVQRLYGVLHLAGHGPLGCLSVVVREESPGGADWLDVSVPTSMLRHEFPVRYPLIRTDNPWLREIDRALLLIADAVYAAAPFALALVGEEASGWTSAREITAEYVAQAGGCLLPPALAHRLRLDGAAAVSPSGLRWFPHPPDPRDPRPVPPIRTGADGDPGGS